MPSVVIKDSAVRKMLQTKKNNLPRVIDATLDWAGIYTQRIMREEAPVHDDDLRREIKVARLGNTRVVGSRVDYAPYVEKGTRPHWTSVRNLEKWALDHGISPYAVQRSIAERGTKANPFTKRTYKQVKPKIISEARKRIEKWVR